MEIQIILDAIVASAEGGCSPEPFEDALALLPNLLEEDMFAERAYARYLRELAGNKVMECCAMGDTDSADRIMSCIEAILKLNARYDFDSYMLFMEWNRPPEKKFYQPRRHVLYPKVVVHLQDLADDELDFLSISMPPRTGKSTTCIFYLTWTMGRHPGRANVMSGHSDKLTKGFHKEALSIITDPTYRFAEVFPKSELFDKSMADETLLLKGCNERFPTLTCRSIEGTLTGAVEVGRDALLYMDDLVEDREEALNVDRMDKLYSAYLNQLKDRMNDGAKQLFVATRWVPNDPIGRIEEQYARNPRYRFVAVPALDENGLSNFDYQYGLGFSTAYYEDMRDSLIDAGEGDSWAAKYMGDPYWMTGLMFPEDELRYYAELPEEECDMVVAVCDTKDRGTDYACQIIGYVYGDRHYIHSVVCDNRLPEVVEPRLKDSLIRNDVSLARYESNSAGGRVADDIQKACLDEGHVVKISKKFSTTNKETRILADSGWIKEHCYFRSDFPDADYKRFMSLLTHYTISGKNRYDDPPDAMSMYKRFVSSMRKAKVEPVKRFM